MNKKLVILIVVVVLLALGGGAYVMMNKSKAPAPEAGTSATPTQAAAEGNVTQGTLKALLAAGIPQTCTFTSEQGAGGTVFVSGNKMRGDFSTKTKDMTINGHMVIDSGYTYIWTDQMKQGFKMALTENKPTGTAGSNQGVDVNQTVSYSCKPWLPDGSKFTLPSDVTFSTFALPSAAAPSGAAPTAGTGAGSAGASDPCSVCNSMPAAAQSACKAQLNCK